MSVVSGNSQGDNMGIGTTALDEGFSGVMSYNDWGSDMDIGPTNWGSGVSNATGGSSFIVSGGGGVGGGQVISGAQPGGYYGNTPSGATPNTSLPSGYRYKINAMGVVVGIEKDTKELPSGSVSGGSAPRAYGSPLPSGQSSGVIPWAFDPRSQLVSPEEAARRRRVNIPMPVPQLITNAPQFHPSVIPSFTSPSLEFKSTQVIPVPSFNAPEYNKGKASEYASKFSAPYIREIRNAIRDAITKTTSTSPMQRRYQLGEAFGSYSEGLGKILGQAAQAGTEQYNIEYANELNSAKLGYVTKAQQISQSNASQAEKDRLLFNAKRDYDNNTAMINYNTNRDKIRMADEAKYRQELMDYQQRITHNDMVYKSALAKWQSQMNV